MPLSEHDIRQKDLEVGKLAALDVDVFRLARCKADLMGPTVLHEGRICRSEVPTFTCSLDR